MVGRSGKSKAARCRYNNRKKNRREREHSNVVDDDGCLFMRAFGTAREVINVTRILSGMPSVLIERNDKRSALSVEIQGDELEELSETIELLGPELKRLCLSKSKSAADKAKHSENNPAPPTLPEENIPSDALIPLRSGKAISSNSLHLRASGKAKSISSYIRILSGLPEDKTRQAAETLDIEGDNLEELLVSLEKLAGNFKKRPRPSKEETQFDVGREGPAGVGGGDRSPLRPNPGRARSGNPGGRPPRRERRRHRREFDHDIVEAFLCFLLRPLFF